MANISDDERLEVDLILEQRKRKGLLEYLVRWKGSGEDIRGDTWEPVKKLTADYAQAIQTFTKSLKAKKSKRSSSRSRKTSRSRSRSTSRSQKSALGEGARSRGQQQKAVVEKVKLSEGDISRPTRSLGAKGKIVVIETSTTSVLKEATESSQVDSRANSNSEPKSESQVIPSSDMKTQQQLEVQRVHNEHCPVRKDDLKPRSAIWKVADYAVIVLFVLSLIAALFLFLEKFIDLKEFKKQAFPNMSVLQTRLESIQQNLVDLAYAGVDRVSDAWQHFTGHVKGAEDVTAKTSGA